MAILQSSPLVSFANTVRIVVPIKWTTKPPSECSFITRWLATTMTLFLISLKTSSSFFRTWFGCSRGK